MKFTRIFCLVCFLLLFLVQIKAYTQEIIQYDIRNNTFDKSFPYGKSFNIEGNAILNGDTIQAVAVKIFLTSKYDKWEEVQKILDLEQDSLKKNKLKQKADKFYKKALISNAGWWLKDTPIKDGKFRLGINTPLFIEQNYLVKFNFYAKSNKAVNLPKVLQRGINEWYVLIEKKGSVPKKELLNQLVLKMQVYIPDSTIQGVRYGEINLSPIIKDNFIRNLESVLESFVDTLVLYSQIIHNSKINIQSTISLLELDSLDDLEKNDFLKLLKDSTLWHQKYYKVFEAYAQKTVNKDSVMSNIEKIFKDYKSVEANKVKLYLIKNNISDRIRILFDGYNITSASTSSSVVTSSTTDLIGTRIGTAYGVGFVDYSGLKDVEMFQYFALKFYMGPYDKRLNDPYQGKIHNRLSWLFGFITTDNLNYKGENLKNTNIGVKPLIGIGFDLWPKQVSINYGMVLFQQSSASNSSLRVRHFVGLSFDFNVINYLIHKK